MIIFIFGYIDQKIKPRIIEICNFQINQFATEQISKAINEAISETGYDYNDYVTFRMGNDNQILAIQTNAKQITDVSNAIINKVNKAISEFDSQTIYVHLGSISGINLLSGRGPKIPIKIVSKGISSSEIISKLEEAGINQTMHKIHIIITVNIAGFFSGFSTRVEAKSDCMLSESLIIGSIPSNYTKIELKNPASIDLNSIHKTKIQ